MALSKDEILEAIKELTVIDLAGLVKDLEEEFGVSAAAPAPVAMRGCPPPLGRRFHFHKSARTDKRHESVAVAVPPRSQSNHARYESRWCRVPGFVGGCPD